MIVWNLKGTSAKLVRFKQSLYHEPLYRWTNHRSLPNEQYTNSMMEDIQELNDLANDQISQTEDARRIATAPPTGYDASQVSRTDAMQYRPRALWPFDGDPREMIKSLDTPDTSTSGLRAFQISLGLINSLGGAGTIAEGQPGRNMPRAGFAVNNLINLGMADIEDVAKTMEDDLFTPGLSDVYKVTNEFIPESQILRIPGTEQYPSRRMTKQDIAGDYEFEWIGTFQSQDMQQRSRTLLITLQLLSQPGIVQQLAQQGFQVNFANLIQMIWRDGLGEKGLGEVIIPMTEQQKQLLQAQQVQALQQGGQQSQQNGSVSAGGSLDGIMNQFRGVTGG